MQPKLEVIMYHYVRNLPESRFPALKGMLLSDFQAQVDLLRDRYEMASLASAIDFLEGRYRPRRDLCLLTFDDGLREHYADVAPILADRGTSGVFFLITGCVEEERVAPVHMNHFLMATLDFAAYRKELWARVRDLDTGAAPSCDREVARRAYTWDTEEVAEFKYCFNFLLDPGVRDRAVQLLFEEHIGAEAPFSRELYLNWKEAREMQALGMTIGGHSHRHRPLSTLSAGELDADLGECRRLLDNRLLPQAAWPFCYPYGRRDSFTGASVERLRALGFACAFSTESGENGPGTDRFVLHRKDCKRAPATPVAMAATSQYHSN